MRQRLSLFSLVESLASRGYKNIAHVISGMSAWTRARLPTIEK